MIKQPYLHHFHTPSITANQNEITVVVINPPSFSTVGTYLLQLQSDGGLLFLPSLILWTYGRMMHPKKCFLHKCFTENRENLEL